MAGTNSAAAAHSRQNHSYTSNQANTKQAQLANAYSTLAAELASDQIKVVGGYTLGKVIGEGTFGSVHIASHRLTGMRCAIKKVAKAATPQLTRELHHHRRLHHPNIVHLHEIIATESHIWLVSELCPGGELFDYLVERGRILEGEARRLFGELCIAVGWLHRQGIVHRDLKLENILLDGELHVKLADLGFAREYQKGRLMDTYCGTTGYASPEMLQCKKYLGVETDVWSLGIILYTLLCGGLPFDDDDERVMKELIVKGQYEEPEWLTENARSLIRGMLQSDPAKRLTIEGILTHPWFQKTIYDNIHNASSTLSIPTSPTAPPPMSSTDSLNRSRPLSSSSATSFPFTPRTTRGPSMVISPVLATSPDESVPSETSLLTSGNTSPTTIEPEDDVDLKRVNSGEFSQTERALELAHRNTSDSTLRRPPDGLRERIARLSLESQREEDESEGGNNLTLRADNRTSSTSLPMIDELSLALPVADHSRTPVRTKRRSLTSQLPLERRLSHHSTSSQWQAFAPDDYLALLNADLPPLFSTPSEKVLLNRLSDLGVDTGQLIHSVKHDACDTSSATWWILRLKQLERGETDDVVQARSQRRKDRARKSSADRDRKSSGDRPHNEPPVRETVPTEPVEKGGVFNAEHSVPRTPDNGFLAPAHALGERPVSSHSTHSALSTLSTLERSQSPPTNPAPGVEQSPTKERKMRSQSMNMLQRATSVLVGGMKKADPTEHLRELREHKGNHSDHKEHTDTTPDPQDDKPVKRGDSPTKMSRFPLPKMTKSESDPMLLSAVAAQAQQQQSQVPQPRSPSVSPTLRSRSYHAGTSGGDDDTLRPLELEHPQPHKLPKKDSIWSTFRHLFNEDRRRQRKRDPSPLRAQGRPTPVVPTRAVRAGGPSRTAMPCSSRRTSFEGTRPMYSRGASSANSRRSSITSTTVPDFTINTHDGLFHNSLNRRASGRSARSGGSMTPTSERGHSRPGSINSRRGSRRSSMMRSPTMQSDSSGRFRQNGPGSPLHDYHRRSASGSASTRVRHMKVLHEAKAIRPSSVASSTRSNASSRASSIHGVDDSDDMRDDLMWKRNDSATSLSKRARSPLSRGAKTKPLRDVFKKDESDWESEEDDFAGGLGQAVYPTSAAASYQSQWNKSNRTCDAKLPSRYPATKSYKKEESSAASQAQAVGANGGGSGSGVAAASASSSTSGGAGGRARRAGIPAQRSQAPVIEEEEEEEE